MLRKLLALSLVFVMSSPFLFPQSAAAGDGKLYVFNAVWFKEDGGREKYEQYLATVGPLLQKYGGRGLRWFEARMPLQGDFDADLFGVVEWPSMEHFQRFLRDPEYQAAAKLREEALVKAVALASSAYDPGAVR